MKILIDEGMASLTKMTGIGYQGINLQKHLSKFCKCDLTDFWYLKPVPKVIRRFSYNSLINIHAIIKDYDLIHYQNYYVPFTKGKAKQVVTIHDLGVFKFPNSIPTIYVKYNQLVIKKALERADAIITPSSFTKDEILNMFPYVEGNKIFPCHNGIREIFWQKVEKETVLKKYGVEPYSYFFFIGIFSRRKNIKFIIETFIKAKKNGYVDRNTWLILGGQKWWGAKDFENLITDDMGIKALGYLDDDEVIQFYKNSKALVYPSLYEGFGMPIIEAMCLNVPIIFSNIPTSIELNKIHNEQMFGFDLQNHDQLMEQFKKLDRDYKNIKSNLDYGNLSRYNFDNVAEKHLEVYKEVLN